MTIGEIYRIIKTIDALRNKGPLTEAERDLLDSLLKTEVK